jgi:glycosyltransferase involved in cell wall biosynthesis
MRVVHVGDYRPGTSNGVNQTIAGLVENLTVSDVSRALWHFDANVKSVKARKVSGVEIYDLPYRRALSSAILPLPKPTREFLASESSTVDLFHLHSVFTRHNLLIAGLGRPYIVTPNGGYSSEVLRGKNRLAKLIWIKLWERRYLDHATTLHAVSRSEVIDLMALGIAENRIALIPNGIGAEQLRYSTRSPSDSDEILFLGRLAVEQKGLDLLIDALGRLRSRKAVVPRVCIAGPNFRGGQKRLHDLAAKNHIEDRVRFVGAVFGEEKRNLVSNARAFVHVSRWEGLPFSILEALAQGRPVIVTSGTGLAEDVESYGAGWVVKPERDAVAAGLEAALCATKVELDRMGESARQLILDKFIWSAIASQLVSVYRKFGQR